MTTNTYTEEEFKKVLKNLFAEKKRVKELQKQLEERGVQKKFQTKLVDIHRHSIAEEYATLKTAYADKERECADLRGKLERVAPALKKLLEEQKAARTEIESLKEKKPHDETLEKFRAFEKEKEEMIDGLKKALEEREREVATLQKEEGRFEAERSRLVERLAEELSHVQRQADIIKDLQQKENENESLKQRLSGLEEEIWRERQAFSLQAQEWEVQGRELRVVTEQLNLAQEQLEKSDFAGVREEYEIKLHAYEKVTQQRFDELIAAQETVLARLNNQIAEVQAERDQAKSEVEEKEKVLEKSYGKMRELSLRHGEMVEEMEKLSSQLEEKKQLEKELASAQHSIQNVKLQCEERDAEIRKAQQHLAKKVKESTILQGALERQKGQIGELQGALAKQKNELERMQNNLNLQQLHEEKLQVMAKERAQAAERVAKEWQEKFLALQQDHQEKKGQLLELQKMRGEYDQMAATVSSLRSILGKSEEA